MSIGVASFVPADVAPDNSLLSAPTSFRTCLFRYSRRMAIDVQDFSNGYRQRLRRLCQGTCAGNIEEITGELAGPKIQA